MGEPQLHSGGTSLLELNPAVPAATTEAWIHEDQDYIASQPQQNHLGHANLPR